MIRHLLPLALLGGCAHHAISGQVIDRNGDPVARAIVSVQPGDVQLVTDPEGRFMFDYLRDEDGERTRLDKRTTYEVEAFKAGYHVATVPVEYTRGELQLELITLTEETIRVEGEDTRFDPADFPDRSHSGGGSYEGE
ncbi:MAG: carboxypeptidase regulatory-like domain-containing protein [Alphaproteobacteria bacterium]|nr:carboxypeptidase regulatory-like domain-containing protein [Alphaproteobacteria bacterium]